MRMVGNPEAHVRLRYLALQARGPDAFGTVSRDQRPPVPVHAGVQRIEVELADRPGVVAARAGVDAVVGQAAVHRRVAVASPVLQSRAGLHDASPAVTDGATNMRFSSARARQPTSTRRARRDHALELHHLRERVHVVGLRRYCGTHAVARARDFQVAQEGQILLVDGARRVVRAPGPPPSRGSSVATASATGRPWRSVTSTTSCAATAASRPVARRRAIAAVRSACRVPCTAGMARGQPSAGPAATTRPRARCSSPVAHKRQPERPSRAVEPQPVHHRSRDAPRVVD